MFRVPVPCVRAVGDRKRTLIRHVAPCARLPVAVFGHVDVAFCTSKITPFVTLVMLVVFGPVIAPGPKLVTVTVCVAPKFAPLKVRNVSDEGEAPSFTPLPLNCTTLSDAASGLPSFVLMVIVAVTAPTAVGWNLT